MRQAAEKVLANLLVKLRRILAPIGLVELTGLLGLHCASLGGTISEGRCCDPANFCKIYLYQVSDCSSRYSKRKVKVGACLPGTRVETGSIIGVVEQSEVVGIGPANQEFTVCTVVIIPQSKC